MELFSVSRYSYLDPLGSLITVSFTNDPIKGYNENRRIQKNYGQVNNNH